MKIEKILSLNLDENAKNLLEGYIKYSYIKKLEEI